MSGQRLEDLMTTKPASTVPLDIPVEPVPIDVQLAQWSEIYWGQQSNELLNAYKTGTSLGKFGDNRRDIEVVFLRFATTLENIVKNELKMEDQSSEKFILHFLVLNAIMRIIGKEMKALDLKKDVTSATIAELHGFIEELAKQLHKG